MGEIMIELIVAVIVLVVMLGAVYVGAVINEEERRGKHIPLIWEKDGFLRMTKRKVFDKSDIKYRDGDNT
jgi:hypothetical protein|tara:strand:- start:105 stop:314 length:210 start_codon:yes stop_codon:yes gene_type:complete